MEDKKDALVICGFVKTCEIQKCVHREPHQKSEACKGMCKYMGYAECREIKRY